MSDYQTKIDITTDTSPYERGMRQVELRTKKTTQALTAAWLAVAGSLYTVAKAYEFAKLGARADQERKSFENLAQSYGTNADLIIRKLKDASAGTVDTMTLVNKAGTAMMMGIDPDKIEKLMEIARATSRMTGQTVTKAFEDISLAVGRQSKMILDNLGIIVRVEDANEKYAAVLGKTASQLTDAEKKQAFMNATIEAGEDLMRRLGDETITTSEKIQQLEAKWSDLKMALNKSIGPQAMLEDAADLLHIYNKIAEVVRGEVDWKTGTRYYPIPKDRTAVNAAPPPPEPQKPYWESLKPYQQNMIHQDAAQVTDMWLTFDEGMQDAHKRSLDMIEQQEREAEAQRVERLNAQYAFEGQMMQDSYGARELAGWEHNTRMLDLEEEYERTRIAQIQAAEAQIVAMKQKSATYQKQIAIGLGTALLAVAGASTKQIFLATKAFDIAMAIISAHAAAAKALAEVPYPANLAVSAQMKAMGYLEAAAIGATAIGQLATQQAGGTGGGSYTSPDVTIPPATTPVEQETRGTLTINIQGDILNEEYIDLIIEKVNAASDRDVYINHSRTAGGLN